uniref:Protein-serine/threonine kinase n=1 Tax=Macaca mulatta TaxID=9544 RepID=A0A5F7ZRZ2_MACMU
SSLFLSREAALALPGQKLLPASWSRRPRSEAAATAAPEIPVPIQIAFNSRPHPSSLGQKILIDFCCINQIRKTEITFLHQESQCQLSQVLTKTAHRPGNVLEYPASMLVRKKYIQISQRLMGFQFRASPDPRAIIKFRGTKITVRNRHKDLKPTSTSGVIFFKQFFLIDMVKKTNKKYHLERTLMIKLRFTQVLYHLTSLWGSKSEGRTTQRRNSLQLPYCLLTGTIYKVRSAERRLCKLHIIKSYILSVGELEHKVPDQPVQYSETPSLLYHFSTQIFKNFLHAQNHHINRKRYNPVKQKVMLRNEELDIKLSERQEVIPLRRHDHLYRKLWSLALSPRLECSGKIPSAGFGFMLPISRGYEQRIKGNIPLYQLNGWCSEKIIWKASESTDDFKKVPEIRESTWKEYNTRHEAKDWC